MLVISINIYIEAAISTLFRSAFCNVWTNCKIWHTGPLIQIESASKSKHLPETLSSLIKDSVCRYIFTTHSLENHQTISHCILKIYLLRKQKHKPKLPRNGMFWKKRNLHWQPFPSSPLVFWIANWEGFCHLQASWGQQNTDRGEQPCLIFTALDLENRKYRGHIFTIMYKSKF